MTTLNELVRADRATRRACSRRALHLPVWPFWLAGALCEAVCVPFGVEPPLYRRRVDFFTKSRAFDITRARAELGYAPKVGAARGHPPHARVVSAEGLDLMRRRSIDTAIRSSDERVRDRRSLRMSRIGMSIPRVQDQLFDRRPSARQKYAALVVGRPGLGALLQVRADAARVAGACPARSASRCARCSIRGCSARAAATSSSARTSCCGTRTRFASATTS